LGRPRGSRATVQNLQPQADKKLSQALALRQEARLKDLSIWVQRKVKDSKTGPRAYTYSHFPIRPKRLIPIEGYYLLWPKKHLRRTPE